MTKRLVVCCDGTWNTSDQKRNGKPCPTNVVKMQRAVASADVSGTTQVVHYHAGVGTGRFDRLLGGAFGWGLSQNVREAYGFIIDQYEEGDAIYLFGFSRGAYTARSTAGLIRKCGVLKREHADRLTEAYNLYRQRGERLGADSPAAQQFRKAYAREVRIRFIGVWDTVGTLGIPGGIPWMPTSWIHRFNKRWAFHDVRLSRSVDYAYQALAIDERRRQFKPTLWEQHPQAQHQTLEQVWFVGVHSNIGGGYPDSGLSDITFQWMKEKAEAAGLAFDEAHLRDLGINPNPLGALRDSREGLYRFLPGAARCIDCRTSDGVAGPRTNEVVHPSATARMEQDRLQVYKPRNLVNYLRRHGLRTLPS